MTAPDLKNGSREIVITFEDLDAQGQAMGPLPSGYMGFTWSDSAWFMTRDIFFVGLPWGSDRAFKCSWQGYNHRKQAPV